MTAAGRLIFAIGFLAGTLYGAGGAEEWLLPNFADRLELEVSNPAEHGVDTLAVVGVREASQVALRFPGRLAIAVAPGATPEVLPVQTDDVDGDGNPDDVVFPVKLGPRESRRIDIYYSTTLDDSIPWPKRVHASHRYGYNAATVALESEVIGYRSYGGFFLDIQARRRGHPGLNNSVVGYFTAHDPSDAGMDIIHLGDTLGLGGIFLRSGADVYRPPLNMPDYAHKPSPADAPRYRIISSGPLRAVVEASLDRWQIGEDVVAVQATYSIAAGGAGVECRFQITPIAITRRYAVGAGLRDLPQMKTSFSAGLIALSGIQTPKVGELGLALYYEPREAHAAAPVITKDGRNECVEFESHLEPGHAAFGHYWVAGAWSGSGIPDLLRYLAGIGSQARERVDVTKLRAVHTPVPQRLEGEAY